MKESRVSYLYSQIGGRYLGVSIPREDVQPYLDQINGLVGIDKYIKLTENQIRRDGGEYHVTLLSPEEYGRCNLDDIEEYIGQEVRLNYIGLGNVKKGKDEVYFVVINSPECDEIRGDLGLSSRDFHITLGFTNKDIFGVRKDESTLVRT